MNLNVPNVSAPNFIKHTLKELNPYTDPNRVLVEDVIQTKNQQRNPRTK
jgi:hypothetical protein